jgi:dihydrofolate reductase
VIWGSASLVTTLFADELVDELVVMIEPILLGGGTRIFPVDGTARPLELAKCVTTDTGVQVCTYRPVSSSAVRSARDGVVRHRLRS